MYEPSTSEARAEMTVLDFLEMLGEWGLEDAVLETYAACLMETLGEGEWRLEVLGEMIIRAGVLMESARGVDGTVPT